MPTKITFETATIADVIKKAARVAPAKSGHAFDKAAGVVVDIFPNEEAKCVVRATNLDVFYTEIVGVLDVEGDEVRWRLPSMVLASVLDTLPTTSGSTVTITQTEDNRVLITSKRMKVTLMRMDETFFPDWDMFDPAGLTQVSGLGGRLAQVEWASSSQSSPPLCGVHLDGEFAIATDRYRLARIPCRVDLPHPVTIPSGILGNVLKPMGDVGLGVNGSTLRIAVDDFAQIQTVIFEAQFPPLGKVTRSDYEQSVTVNKTQLINILNRANQFAGADRSPMLKMYVGKGEVAVMMENEEIGLMGDVVECLAGGDHPRTEFKFTPKNILDGVSKSPNDKIELRYDPSNTMRAFYIDGGSGYESWIVPRKETKPSI